MSYSTGQDAAQLAQTISCNIQKITQSCNQEKIQYAHKIAKDTDRFLKDYSSLPSESDQRQRKLQKDRLVNEFSSALANFQKIQRQAAEKEKEFVARVRAGSRVSGGFPDDGQKEGSLLTWENEGQQQATMQEEEFTEDDLNLIEERETAIRQLEDDIQGINEIFKTWA
ncbi:hypothetical protein XELAEV_18003498mg [Xenopus laevis]|nr:hypothetical protein XELAEV_18003498mg [Xenopus laevis]